MPSARRRKRAPRLDHAIWAGVPQSEPVGKGEHATLGADAIHFILARRTTALLPAHQSMINRRFMIVPPALPSGGRAEAIRKSDHDFLRVQLEGANVRVVRT